MYVQLQIFSSLIMESSVMEVILATFQSSLDKKLEEESNLSATDKQDLKDRFMTHFKQVRLLN